MNGSDIVQKCSVLQNGVFCSNLDTKIYMVLKISTKGEILIGQKCFFIQIEGDLSFFCEIWQSVLGQQSYKVHSAHPPPAFLHGGGKLSLQPNFQKVGAWQDLNF